MTAECIFFSGFLHFLSYGSENRLEIEGRNLRRELLVHEQDEGGDIVDDIEENGAVEVIGGGFDLCILHLRGTFPLHPVNFEERER